MTRVSALLLATVSVGATAQQSTPDPHIQSVPYDAARIVPLRIAPGFVATVAFAPDERIENVAVGNPAAWQITANKQGDHLFVRALQDGGVTNLEVVTDARHYSFLLTASNAGDPGTVFSMRFDYGPADAAHVPPAAMSEVPEVPGLYRLAGSRRVRPTAMSDDGRITRICWPARDVIPAIFARDATGGERLANSRVENGCAVVDTLWTGYRFVADDATATARRIVAPGAKR